jgi:3-deoxy-D-manno-octulosonate 8-phosphate phosphatase (KDO 8-P phosphatase)
MNQILEDKLKGISTFVFDIDGVFTDATLTVSKDDVTRTFNVRDGYAVQMALKSGYNVAIISGGKQESIITRMNSIGVEDVFIKVGTADKPKFLEEYLKSKNVSAEEVLFIGDDIPDLLLMQAFPVLSCCPSDAVEEVKAAADYIVHTPGGKGAVREAIELVMKAQDKWMKVF